MYASSGPKNCVLAFSPPTCSAKKYTELPANDYGQNDVLASCTSLQYATEVLVPLFTESQPTQMASSLFAQVQHLDKSVRGPFRSSSTEDRVVCAAVCWAGVESCTYSLNGETELAAAKTRSASLSSLSIRRKTASKCRLWLSFMVQNRARLLSSS